MGAISKTNGYRFKMSIRKYPRTLYNQRVIDSGNLPEKVKDAEILTTFTKYLDKHLNQQYMGDLDQMLVNR